MGTWGNYSDQNDDIGDLIYELESDANDYCDQCGKQFECTNKECYINYVCSDLSCQRSDNHQNGDIGDLCSI